MIAIPDTFAEPEKEARFSMLEKLADYDDELMEQLLEDVPPPRDKVFDDLSKELRDGLICPVLLGSAENGNGILRLLKALRHEAPFVVSTAKRLGVAGAPSCAYILKTFHTAHGGKLSLARVLAGTFADGITVHGGGDDERISGIFTLLGQEPTKRGEAQPGDTVALGRLDSVKTGETLAEEKGKTVKLEKVPPAQPVFGLTIAAKEKKDEVKLTAAIAKIIEEDPSISLTHSQDMGEMVLWGQGEMHLRVALERLVRKFGIDASTRARQIPYKETIRKSVEVRGRHKKQSGGHGQFGDVVVTIKPLPRGQGFEFSDEITGGVVPKNYFPSVEIGVRDYLHSGPLGFHVVDVGVCLIDGSYHSVEFFRHGLPPGGAHRHERGAAAMLAGAARADHGGRDRGAVRRHGQDQRHHLDAARADPGLRCAPRLARLGFGGSPHPGGRDPEFDRGAALGDGRRRHLHGEIRSSRRTHRQDRRSGAGDPRGEGGLGAQKRGLLAAPIQACEFRAPQENHLWREAATALDPGADVCRIGGGDGARRLAGGVGATRLVDQSGSMEAEHRPPGDADAVTRNCAQHQGTGREAWSVDDNPFAGLAELRKKPQIAPDRATSARQDAHLGKGWGYGDEAHNHGDENASHESLQ